MPPKPFQAFTTRYSGLTDRIVTPIRVIPGYDPANPPDPIPGGIETSALWDTGASRSVVAADLARSLALTPVGVTKVNHAGGTGESPTYLVNFILPNNVHVAGLIVSEFSQLPGGFQALVGMDVIRLGDLSLTHLNGESCMSFRTPSIHCVDFVQEANRIAWAHVGRNDPCPCGAKNADGTPKLFKFCHKKSLEQR